MSTYSKNKTQKIQAAVLVSTPVSGLTTLYTVPADSYLIANVGFKTNITVSPIGGRVDQVIDTTVIASHGLGGGNTVQAAGFNGLLAERSSNLEDQQTYAFGVMHYGPGQVVKMNLVVTSGSLTITGVVSGTLFKNS